MSKFFDDIAKATAKREREKSLTFSMFSFATETDNGKVFGVPCAFIDDNSALLALGNLITDGTFPVGTSVYRIGSYCFASGKFYPIKPYEVTKNE